MMDGGLNVVLGWKLNGATLPDLPRSAKALDQGADKFS